MDPFAVLGVQACFDVNLADVEKRHRDLSRALHPDKFAATGAAERQLALSKAIEVNEAWRVVRDPVRRAEALFGLAGVATGESQEPKPEPAFLLDMLEQREALAEAKQRRDGAAVHALATAIRERQAGVEQTLKEGFREAGRTPALVGKLGELRFYRRFLEEVSAIEDEMEG